MNNSFFVVFAFFFLMSCQGNQEEYDWEDDYYDEFDEEVENSSKFELKFKDKGLSCDDYYTTLAGYNIKNRITYGERLYFNFNDIRGFELKDGDLTAEMMFLFLSLDGDTLDYSEYGKIDPLAFYYAEDESIDLNLNSNMIDPFFSGKSYLYKAGFRDPNSGNSLEIETEVKIVRNTHIYSDKKGLKCGDPYVYNEAENEFVTDNNISRNVDYYFGFHGLRGFQEIDGEVELGLSVVIYDEYDNETSNSGDLYADDGWMNSAEVFDELSASFTVYEHYDDEIVSVYVKVWDKNSERSLTIHSDFWLYD